MKKISKRDLTLLFVYGTLKNGGENHFRLKDSEFIGIDFTKPEYTLTFVNGDSPDVKLAGHQEVEGELYLVSRKVLKEIDEYEKPYNRHHIDLESDQKAQAYFL